MPIRLLLALCLICSTAATAQEAGVKYEWEVKRDRDGIVISTSAVEGSPYKAVKGEMRVQGRVASLVALIEDLDACPDWAALCKKASLVKRVSPTESFVHLYNDIPFPVSDRDAYAHIIWSSDESGRVTMTSTAQAEGYELTKAVRLVDALTQWHFTDLGDGTVRVENFAHIDPNGPTPAWITNLLLVDSPFDSMTEMRSLIEGGAYADVEIEFVSNWLKQ